MKSKYLKENLVPIVKECNSYSEVCIALGMVSKGGNFYTIKKYIELHGIDTSHFITRNEQLHKMHRFNTIPLDEILVVNSTYKNNKCLKNRIKKENLIPQECKICKNKGEWQGQKLVLQLDHINGINNDNRIENLRLLCPNCHSQTDTFSGRHTSKKVVEAKRKQLERENNNGHTNLEVANYIKRRKVVDRPSKEDLIIMINKVGYKDTGRKYGVSDNTIRKWVK